MRPYVELVLAATAAHSGAEALERVARRLERAGDALGIPAAAGMASVLAGEAVALADGLDALVATMAPETPDEPPSGVGSKHEIE